MKEEIMNWWKQALHDLKAAEYNFEGDLLDTSSFLSQQARKPSKLFTFKRKNFLKKLIAYRVLLKN